MLRWKVAPHPWFQLLVQWALYTAIVKCDTPPSLRQRPVHDQLGLPHMTDGDIRLMCSNMLVASKSGENYLPKEYGFRVIRSVLYWALTSLPGISSQATNNIVQRYCYDVVEEDIRDRPPDQVEYGAHSTGFRQADNTTDPEEDELYCLFGIASGAVDADPRSSFDEAVAAHYGSNLAVPGTTFERITSNSYEINVSPTGRARSSSVSTSF